MGEDRRTQSEPPGSDRITQRPGEPVESPDAETPRAPTVRQVEVTDAFLSKTPRVVLPPEELNAADLDHRDYFLISLMDGITTVENVLDICGMPSEEAVALLDGLERRGIIAFSS